MSFSTRRQCERPWGTTGRGREVSSVRPTFAQHAVVAAADTARTHVRSAPPCHCAPRYASATCVRVTRPFLCCANGQARAARQRKQARASRRKGTLFLAASLLRCLAPSLTAALPRRRAALPPRPSARLPFVYPSVHGWSRTKGGVELIKSAATTLAGIGLERAPTLSRFRSHTRTMGGKAAPGFEPGPLARKPSIIQLDQVHFRTAGGAKIAYMNNFV